MRLLQAAFLLTQLLSQQPASADEATLQDGDADATPPRQGDIQAAEESLALSWASSEADLLATLEASNEASAASADEEAALARSCVARSWWTAARKIVENAHSRTKAGGGSSEALFSAIRLQAADAKKGADEFANFAHSTYRGQTDGLVEVHCAIQWAQNETAVFLGVKYAARWSAPGAIEVVDVTANITSSGFYLNGYGHHSGIRKRYIVDLDLFGNVSSEGSQWSAASVGRMTATLLKAKPGKWTRLVRTKDKVKHPITKWLDMEEKWNKKEGDGDSKAKKTKDGKDKPKEKAEDDANDKKKKKKEKSKDKPEGKSEEEASSSARAANKGKTVYTPWKKKMLKYWKKMPKWVQDYYVLIASTIACLIGVVVIEVCKRRMIDKKNGELESKLLESKQQRTAELCAQAARFRAEMEANAEDEEPEKTGTEPPCEEAVETTGAAEHDVTRHADASAAEED
eukprot:TRINITY_DN19027_c0_g1_i1.p1 TRINITY_DN19027_c0_g1~~TRINITY_DN19027_c0_g1_i1.p1  ORF type:complete len:493 (+),score=155.41 TRINITY_DN19027_c0_g1_i1:104-1480(+)